MPKPDPSIGSGRASRSSRAKVSLPANQRVDSPHVFPGAAAKPREPNATAPSDAFNGAECTPEQLRLHAEQIAAHFHTRQKELDHREAELNSRTATFESDMRAAKLWLSEHEIDWTARCGELAQQQEFLAKQQQELAAKQEQLAKDGGEIAQQRTELVRQQQSLATAHQEVERRLARLAAASVIEQKRSLEPTAELQEAKRQFEIERRQAEEALQLERQELEQRRISLETQSQEWQRQKVFVASNSNAEQEEALRRERELIDARKRQFDEAETQMSMAQIDIARIQEALLAERRTIQEELVTLRGKAAKEQREAVAELERKRQAVQRRSEHVDHCRAALTQLYGELEYAQRETLEVRLATEELWVKLSGAAPPAALTRSLGRIRSRLAEHYRRTDAELAERKREFESIRAELTAQCGTLMEQKRSFEQWAAHQQAETEQQASRLIAREQQLQREETQLREELLAWRGERMRYQQEIRLLRAELAFREEAAVTT
jgi:hypothetical protein